MSSVDWREGHTDAMKRPETPDQATEWQQTQRLAHEVGGLCFNCSCQFAYGVQHAFRFVEPPCTECHAVMTRWAVRETSGWGRPATGRLCRPGAWRSYTDSAA